MRTTLCFGAWASHYGGDACYRAQAVGTQASFIAMHGLSSWGSWALEHRLSSCDAQASLLCGMWNFDIWIEPMSPALAGGFSNAGPPGKPSCCFLYLSRFCGINVQGFFFCFVLFFWYSFFLAIHLLKDISVVRIVAITNKTAVNICV